MPLQDFEKSQGIDGVNPKLNLRGASISELISRTPGFLERWALSIFFLILVFIGTGSWFIKYPDVIRTGATLLSTNTPKEIIPKQDGRILKLFLKNKDTVSAGSIIGYIESNAKYEQVVITETLVDSTILDLKNGSAKNIMHRFAFILDSLGELQEDYQKFIVSHQQFVNYLQNGFYLKKHQVLEGDLALLSKDYQNLLQQRELLKEDLRLSEETYKANLSLLNDRIISKQDNRIEQSKLIAKQMSIPQINSSLLTNEKQQRTKREEILDLEHSISMQKTIFTQATNTFKSAILEWTNRFVFKAPISGRLIYLTPIQENKVVQVGRSIGFIAPFNVTYFVEITLPQSNFGKSFVGQPVQLHFHAYPFVEFGYVSGRLSYISDIASDTGFLATVQLDNGLVTNRGNTLQYREGLKAEAKIITKDIRLLERFYRNTLIQMDR